MTVLRRLLGVVAGLLAVYIAGLAAFGLLAEPRASDLIVVLGNELDLDGSPSPRLRARLNAALAVFGAGLAPRVLVSGGIEQPGGRDEAAAMAGYLVGHGVPAEAIVQDPDGADTMGTARTVAGLLHGGGRVLVVTQWFHVPRTVWALRHLGQAEVSAAWPRFAEWRDIYSLAREAVGLPVYVVRFSGLWGGAGGSGGGSRRMPAGRATGSMPPAPG